MSSTTRRSSSSTKKKTVTTSTISHTGHRDIRESFASPDPQDTKQLTSVSQASHLHQTKPLSDALSEDTNTLISITRQNQPKESMPRLASPSRLTRQRLKELCEQESKPQPIEVSTPPTSTGASSNTPTTQHPILDNVTARWRRLTRGIPSPEEPTVSRATERKRKLTGDDSNISVPFSSSRQRAVTFSNLVGGNKDSLDQDNPNRTMPIMSQIENRSKNSQSKKTSTRGNR
ncbi:hypothetical protein BGX24_002238 [Mortierella sp. AD032]|nr:hypothetical protein BGX24_002238 [Mortierella sp. AD032]